MLQPEMATEVGDTYRQRRRKKRVHRARDGVRDCKIKVITMTWAESKTRVLVDVHPKVYEKLCELADTGLYGFSPADCAERLIAEQLRWILRQK